MFESLDDKIRRDAAAEISRREQVLKAVLIATLSVLLFGGLYCAVRILE